MSDTARRQAADDAQSALIDELDLPAPTTNIINNNERVASNATLFLVFK